MWYTSIYSRVESTHNDLLIIIPILTKYQLNNSEQVHLSLFTFQFLLFGYFPMPSLTHLATSEMGEPIDFRIVYGCMRHSQKYKFLRSHGFLQTYIYFWATNMINHEFCSCIMFDLFLVITQLPANNVCSRTHGEDIETIKIAFPTVNLDIFV